LYAPNGTYNVKQGQIFLIKPGEVNIYTADEKEPWDYIWIEFNGAAATQLKDVKNPVIDCDERIFKNIWEARNKEYFIEEYVVSNLFLLLPAILEEKKPASFSLKIQNYIYSNYMKEIKIEEIAKIMGYSRQHISRVFKADTGMSIQEFLKKTRFSNAKEILKKGYSVTETAYMCGYNDMFNFSKGFKTEFGLSPTEWKKMHLMNNYSFNE